MVFHFLGTGTSLRRLLPRTSPASLAPGNAVAPAVYQNSGADELVLSHPATSVGFTIMSHAWACLRVASVTPRGRRATGQHDNPRLRRFRKDAFSSIEARAVR
jgi:hypothetical protein